MVIFTFYSLGDILKGIFAYFIKRTYRQSSFCTIVDVRNIKIKIIMHKHVTFGVLRISQPIIVSVILPKSTEKLYANLIAFVSGDTLVMAIITIVLS